MKRISIAATIPAFLWVCCGGFASAQSMDDLTVQIHGYATQAFVYTNHNSWDTTDSEDGSESWTEAVVNLSLQPLPKLRIGIQARYYLLGDYGDRILLDWAQADYKVNESFGFRVGDVKTPVGLLNETQDIDPAHLWVLLPQSVYPLASRNSQLDHYGAVVYGAIPLGESFGKLEYRAFGGQRVIGSDDGAFQTLKDGGFAVPNGVTGKTFGGTLRWNTPVKGLLVGASENAGRDAGELTAGSSTGTLSTPQLRQTWYFGRYERNKLMLAGEYSRMQVLTDIQLTGAPAFYRPSDQRRFYGMASYKLTSKLTGGLYYSSYLDRKAAFTSARYQKDWALSARYDFNPFLYAKAEQHLVDGTAIGLSDSDNPNLQPNMRMTMLKVGVSF
jgi:hypothetical protein